MNNEIERQLLLNSKVLGVLQYDWGRSVVIAESGQNCQNLYCLNMPEYINNHRTEVVAYCAHIPSPNLCFTYAQISIDRCFKVYFHFSNLFVTFRGPNLL